MAGTQERVPVRKRKPTPCPEDDPVLPECRLPDPRES